jgi:hypothetical protein
MYSINGQTILGVQVDLTAVFYHINESDSYEDYLTKFEEESDFYDDIIEMFEKQYPYLQMIIHRRHEWEEEEFYIHFKSFKGDSSLNQLQKWCSITWHKYATEWFNLMDDIEQKDEEPRLITLSVE